MFKVQNWIDGAETQPVDGIWIENRNPHNNEVINLVANSSEQDVDLAITSASRVFESWSGLTPVERGAVLGAIVSEMRLRADELAKCIALETGKPPRDANSEVKAAILQGEYFSGEGMRLYGRSLTSGMPGKYSHTVRHPLGVTGLIVPANTPIANIAWKVFPALICGNSIVLKAAEDSPEIALLFAKITKKAGLPDGVLNVVQGRGKPAGTAIVADPRVRLISFTGSTSVGREIAEVGGKRLARISLELGGKNPFIVCDDASLEQAVSWASLSAFSNAGQRCASGSRIIVFDGVYDEFVDRLVIYAKNLRLGVSAESDLGPVISQYQQHVILDAIDRARKQGGRVLCGGRVPTNSELAKGNYIEPTLIEGLSASADLSRTEVFGPVATIYRVRDSIDALELANDTAYGLTAAVHTTNVDRAMWFAQHIRAGVVNINIGTFGSEPHMPFGGFGASGNGTREPGIEALDVYSETKNISFLVRSECL